MGLGKTLQTIAFLGWMKFVQNLNGPFLIIVPLSVLSNWLNEFKRFLPNMRVLKLHTSDSNERKRLKKEVLPNILNEYDVVLTTYDIIKTKDMKNMLISRIYWRYIVLDEGHIVRHEETIIAETVRKLHFENVLLLTGILYYII